LITTKPGNLLAGELDCIIIDIVVADTLIKYLQKKQGTPAHWR